MLHMFSDLPAFRRDALEFLQIKGREPGPLVRLSIGLRPAYMITEPSLFRQTLQADEAAIDKGRLVFKLREIVGGSSLIISGAAHRERRGLIHRTLAQGVSGDLVPRMAMILDSWRSELIARSEFDAHEATAHLAIRIISTILFGPDALSSGDQAAIIQAVHLVEDDLAEGMFRVLPDLPWIRLEKKRRLQWAREIMALVIARVRSRAASSSLLNVLVQAGVKGQDLEDEILMLLLAGHHTSGSAAAWALYHLALDPGLSRRLASEAEGVFQPHEEPRALNVRAASLSRAYANEILRLYPSTYWTSRELKQDHVVGGRMLKRGTSLIFSPWQLHRDQNRWPDATEFRLDRDWTSNPAYVPFGFGSRSCIGLNVAMLELQMTALVFAQSFQAEVISGSAQSPKPSITLVPPPIRIRVASRRLVTRVENTVAA